MGMSTHYMFICKFLIIEQVIHITTYSPTFFKDNTLQALPLFWYICVKIKSKTVPAWVHRTTRKLRFGSYLGNRIRPDTHLSSYQMPSIPSCTVIISIPLFRCIMIYILDATGFRRLRPVTKDHLPILISTTQRVIQFISIVCYRNASMYFLSPKNGRGNKDFLFLPPPKKRKTLKIKFFYFPPPPQKKKKKYGGENKKVFFFISSFTLGPS